MEILVIVLYPLLLLLGLAIPFLMMEKITNFFICMFPQFDKQKIKESVEVSVVVLFIMLSMLVVSFL